MTRVINKYIDEHELLKSEGGNFGDDMREGLACVYLSSST